MLAVRGQQGSDMDDDFQSRPIATKRTGKKSKGALGVDEHNDVQRIYTRARPGELKELLQALSDIQKAWVRELGFGGLFHLDIRDTPSRLGYWLVSNFDPRSRTLKLSSGGGLRITAHDVAVTLGFSMGGSQMVKKRKSEANDLSMQWRSLFDRQNFHITPNEVCKRVLSNIDDVVWFKRHFATLVVTVLAEGMRNGYCNHHYMDHFEDVSKIRELDWAGCVIQALINTKLDWDRNRRQTFTGPLLFLMVCVLFI